MRHFSATLLPTSAEDLAEAKEISLRSDTMHHAILAATAEAEKRGMRVSLVRDVTPGTTMPVFKP